MKLLGFILLVTVQNFIVIHPIDTNVNLLVAQKENQDLQSHWDTSAGNHKCTKFNRLTDQLTLPSHVTSMAQNDQPDGNAIQHH